MALTYEDFVRTRNGQLLGVLTSWQQISLEAYRGFIKSAGTLIPDLNLYHELPTAVQDSLGNSEAILDDNYGFVLAVLDLQREFVREVFRSSFIAPRTPFVPPAG